MEEQEQMALRGRFQDTQQESAESRPSTYPSDHSARIGYDPLLITRLRQDHRNFIELFSQAQLLLNSADYEGVKRKLGELRIALQDHLLLASTKFYIYLSRLLAYHSESMTILNRQRSAMHHNSREIMDFLRTYSAIRLDSASAPMFQEEFLKIGATLMNRIENEENHLFPLYRDAR